MTNPVTPNIGLNKIDRTSPSTTYFDLEKYIDQNADAVDQFAGETKQSLDSLASRLDTEERREVVLQPGLQVVHAERTAPFSLSGIKGRTLVNLLGRDGGCESVRGFVVSSNSTLKLVTSFKDQGNYSIEVNQITTGNSYTRAANAISINPNSYYLALAVVKASTSTEVTVRLVKSDGSASLSGSKGNTIFPGETGLAWKAYNPTELNGNDSVKFDVFTNGVIPQGDGYCFDSLRLYEISFEEYEAIDNMSQNELSIKYPYIDGMQSVSNPYVIRYGENLLPPFYEWSWGAADVTVRGPYEALLNRTGAGQNIFTDVPHVDGTNYRFSVVYGENALGQVQYYNAAGDAQQEDLSDNEIIEPPAGTVRIRIVLAGPNGPLSFRNPMLTLGTELQSFVPREDFMLAFQTDLHANPVDSSDPDVLFEREGQYFKLAKWKRVVLDGSLNWGYSASSSSTGYKGVYCTGLAPNSINRSALITKYNGTVLETKSDGQITGPDQNNGIGGSNLYLSIPNADSGWGADYTPTQDEIKAYFWGWKMYDTTGATSSTYNRTDGAYKGWVRRRSYDGAYVDGTGTLPTTFAPEYTPYHLVYRLAKPTVEPVVSEGCLTLNEGDNQVEVGTGIVLRENNNASIASNGVATFNGVNFPLKYKASAIIELNRDDMRIYPDGSGLRTPGTPLEIANGPAWVNLNPENYDPSAIYSVTYLKLDKSLIQPVSGSLAASEKSQISDLTKGVAKALQRVSVVEMKKAEKDSPGWIAPTLLNGWVRESTTFGYVKDPAGNVRFRGRISSGATASGTLLFTLPVGVRPTVYGYYQVTVNTGASLTTGFIMINIDGTVVISYFPGNTWINWDTVSFLAEQ
ncbi:hypothetical protein GNP94_11140 [Paenibacillus campinasensis]|uniref:CBM6 domain-containing protein n=1 Tax=Paenibacillus campinasensis TaxID=66347 RepID=A0ABW9T0D2_9BACL|nr:hypothetical protein [Paenibacillus campinasensis]MUG66554.1 hypothetical protein [Paenibacillus campinasensis]